MLATVMMVPAGAYAAGHTHVTLAPGGSSQTKITTPSSGTVTSSSGSGTGTLDTQGSTGTTTNPSSGSGGGLSIPGTPGAPGTPGTPGHGAIPPVTCSSNCSTLLYYQPSGPPPPTCWWTVYGGLVGNTQLYHVACTSACPLVTEDISGPCSAPAPLYNCKLAFDNSLEMYCPPTPGTSGTPGYQTSWTVGTPGDGGTVCVIAWKIVFQDQTQTLTDGGNCYTSPPTVNYKYICNVQPTYSISAEVTAPGGIPLTIYSHFAQNGYSYTLPAQSFPQWFLVSSGTMSGPSSCPNSTWNFPPSGIKVTTSVSAPQGGILSNGDIQALGEPIHIDYTPTLYGGHLILNTGVSCASPTTDTYYRKWLWVTGGGHTSLQFQQASNGKMYHLIDGMRDLPYNASITGDETADGGKACQATLHIHGPTPPGAPYIVQAIPQFTYTYGILKINLATNLAGLVQVTSRIKGSGMFPKQVPCTKHVDKNGHKTKIHTTCQKLEPRTKYITFSTLQASSVGSVLTQTTSPHQITVHSPQVNQNAFNAERPYIKSQSY